MHSGQGVLYVLSCGSQLAPQTTYIPNLCWRLKSCACVLEKGVRSLFGGVLCCVLRVPIRTMDYSKCLEGCACVLGGVCVACLVVLYVAS